VIFLGHLLAELLAKKTLLAATQWSCLSENASPGLSKKIFGSSSLVSSIDCGKFSNRNSRPNSTGTQQNATAHGMLYTGRAYIEIYTMMVQ